ncbi:MAG TPA: hypothetical protein VL422_00785 [Miltoncostaea sp.]|nr:hypothetical protein [Miltoncostaea sp.]
MSLVRSRPLAALAVVGAAAAIAGCGGGGDDSGALSADEFRTQADAICSDANTRIAALDQPTGSDQILGYLQSGLTVQKEQLQKLKALQPPSDLSSDFNAATDLLDQQTAKIQDATTKIQNGEDPTAVISAASPEIDSISEQAKAKAKALGLEVCGTEDTAGTATTGTTATTATAPPVATVTTPETSTAGPTATGDTAGYVEDVQAAAGALTTFGTALQSTTSLDDLKTKVPQATAALDDFDTAIARLKAYTLSDATLDKQRAGLVRTGPKVSDVLRRFLAAAQKGDVAGVQALVPEVTSTIQEFQQAATGG